MLKLPKIPETGIKVEHPQDNFSLYSSIEREEFYKILLWLEWKIVRVSPELFTDLKDYNTKNWSKKNPHKEYPVKLEKFKKNTKYKWKPNHEIQEIDTKYLRELWSFANPNEFIEDAVIVISEKEPKRILAIAYKVRKGELSKVRCYVRYTTLTEKPQKAQRVIEIISKRFWNILDGKITEIV